MLAAAAALGSVTWCSGEGCDILEALSEGREPPKPPKPKKPPKKPRKAATTAKFASLPSFARVISLPGEDARWEQVVVELGAMGLEARRAVAVQPSELSSSKLLRVRAAGAGGEPFGPKELACGMSHLKAWREIADGDEPYGLIVEDDAVLHPRATRELLAATVAQLPASFTVAWLGSCYSHLEMGGVSELPRDRALVRGAARCTHAYMVSKDGAARLVQELSILRDAVDRQMAQLCTLRYGDCYVAYPRWRRPAGSRLWGHGLLLQDWRFSSPSPTTRAPGCCAITTPSPATTPRASRPRKRSAAAAANTMANSPRMTAPRPSRRRPSPRWRPWSPSAPTAPCSTSAAAAAAGSTIASVANYVICSYSR